MRNLANLSRRPLPVPFPRAADGVGKGSHRRAEELFAVADAPVIFTPRHFGGVSRKILSSDVVMSADFRAAQAGEKAFRHVRAAFRRRVRLLMINALGQEANVQFVPMDSFVGMNDCTGCSAFDHAANAFAFVVVNEGQGAALALADYDDDAALASLMLFQATVNTVFFAVSGAVVTAEVTAINFNVTFEGSAFGLGCAKGFADF